MSLVTDSAIGWASWSLMMEALRWMTTLMQQRSTTRAGLLGNPPDGGAVSLSLSTAGGRLSAQIQTATSAKEVRFCFLLAKCLCLFFFAFLLCNCIVYYYRTFTITAHIIIFQICLLECPKIFKEILNKFAPFCKFCYNTLI